MGYLIIFLLMLLNGVFAMAEASLIASRRFRLERMSKQGSRRARMALKLASDPHKFLSTTQLGITLISVIAGAYGASEISDKLAADLKEYPVIAEFAGTLGSVLIILFTTYLSLVFGELVPKTIAIARPESIASALAPVMWLLYYVALPFIWLLTISNKLILRLLRIRRKDEPPVTEEELKAIIDQSRKYGVLEEMESEMMKSIFKTADRRVNSIMTHRTDLVWLDQNATQEEMMRTIEKTIHSSFPVCDKSLDHVLGIVFIKDVLLQIQRSQSLNIPTLIRKPLYVPESMPALELLENFRSSGMHVALALNEYGSLEGLVTLHDVTEAIFGDIPIMAQARDEAIRRTDGSWLIDGMMQTPRWSDLLGMNDLNEEETGNYNTLGGFVMHQMGSIPKAGDQFEFRNHLFEVMDMDGMRVDKVLVSKLPEEAALID
ncbi:MAG: HlyC/CorC family transporter [Bacteroidetes bacterium]|nr:HlyC/CorC family transporter [Bacteroidota bacterium]